MNDLPKEPRHSNRKFASIKMDWDDALMYDTRLTNAAARLGFVMMQYANEKADDPFFVWPSIEALAHEAGSMDPKHARKSIKLLIETGWVRCECVWYGGKQHNNYTLLFDNVQTLLDAKRLQARLRRERRLLQRGQGPEYRGTPLSTIQQKKLPLRGPLRVIDGGQP